MFGVPVRREGGMHGGQRERSLLLSSPMSKPALLLPFKVLTHPHIQIASINGDVSDHIYFFRKSLDSH